MAKHKDNARGYAESIYAVAEIENAVELLEDQLFEIGKGISGTPDLRSFLDNKDVDAAAKKKALGEILTAQTSPIIRSYSDMLIDSGKGGELAGVAEAFVSLSQEKKNKVLAEVTSAVSLTPELTDKLKDTLAKNTGKNISVKNTVDAAILGGLIIKMEDKIIDLSVRRRLGALQDSLRSNL